MYPWGHIAKENLYYWGSTFFVIFNWVGSYSIELLGNKVIAVWKFKKACAFGLHLTRIVPIKVVIYLWIYGLKLKSLYNPQLNLINWLLQFNWSLSISNLNFIIERLENWCRKVKSGYSKQPARGIQRNLQVIQGN